ncbi:MAG: lysine--tRNA ligase [Thermoplasmatota archaeon]
MHWADVIAKKLHKEQKKHVLATGITPSGPIHIGNMREILTTDAIYRCLVDLGSDVEFIFVADDYDPLRKVYPYLPKTYEQHVGKPISDIPCPCGKHASYAEHYLKSFLESLKMIGVNPHIYWASEMYKNKMYAEAIQIALENSGKIRNIIEDISKRTLPKRWLPFNIVCEKCKKITTTQPVLYQYPSIEYGCDCGNEGEIDIRNGGVGKLPWRIDWPARWKILQVTFEPCGKDHTTVGGSRDTSQKIVEEIYNYPHPGLLAYEFIMLKGKGAMHSSKGTALSSEEMLQMTPPEVLRFLLMKNQPERHITFDTGIGLLNLVDEYDKVERVYFGDEEEPKGMKDLSKIYELSQPYHVPKAKPYQVPYRHLVTLVQIAKNWTQLKKIMQRTNQIPQDLRKEDENILKQRSEHVRYWLKTFAPDIVKFSIKKNLPKISLTNEQKRFLVSFKENISTLQWNPESIHTTIYETSMKNNINVKTAFTALYKIVLGQENGPRAGYFLSNIDKDFILSRITEAII